MEVQSLELNVLIETVQEKLKEAGYTDRCIERFFPTWAKLRTFMEQRGLQVLNAKLGLDFLEEVYEITVFRNLPRNLAIPARAVNVLTDYQQHGIILAKAKRKVHVFHPQFQSVFQNYLNQRQAERFSVDTIQSAAIYLDRFSDYLHNHGVPRIQDLNENLVLGFTQTFTNYSPAVVHCTLCALRTFFHYLYQQGFTPKDYAYIVPRDGYRSRTKVPSAYSKEDVQKLLQSVDRGNPKGKRDYAILLLAARLGLRAQDICDLSFEHVKWETNTIEIIQGKTEKPVILPLLEDIGLALIDYLKYARPDCTATDAIFLRLIPPVGKLEAPTLHSIVTHYLRKAEVKVVDGKRHGPHALRHSLASALLEERTPLPVISEILGHTRTASTSVYLKIDINQLRSCALTPPPFDWNKGEEVF